MLTPRGRYLAPAIDKDNRTAAVSRFTVSGENQLVLVDLAAGKEQRYFTVRIMPSSKS